MCALVTGVQTCALPISRFHLRRGQRRFRGRIAYGTGRGADRDDRGRIEGRLPSVQFDLYPAREARGCGRSISWGPARLMEFRASRSEEHTSELQSLMSSSYTVFCLKKK